MFVHKPRQISPGRYESGPCTTNRAAPTADVLITLLQAFRTILALALSDRDYQGLGISRDADIAIGTSATILFATSAGYGLKTIATCAELEGGRATPYRRPEVKRTSEQRRTEEAAEEAAVQARLKAKAAADARAKAAADAKAAAETSGAAPGQEGDEDEP
jgi:hypothetical protein